MLTLLSISVLILLYIFAAPTQEEQNHVSMLLFNAKSAIRRRPTLDSVPFAQVHEGTKLEVVQVRSDWVQVSIKTNVVGSENLMNAAIQNKVSKVKKITRLKYIPIPSNKKIV